MTNFTIFDAPLFAQIAHRQKRSLNDKLAVCAKSAVKKRMRECFMGFARFSREIIEFKDCVLKNKARNVLQVFRRCVVQGRQAKEMKVEKEGKMKYKALKGLHGYTQRRQQNISKGLKVGNKHQIKVFSQFFSAWRELYGEYNTLMRENYAKKTIARAHYLGKFFFLMKKLTLQKFKVRNFKRKTLYKQAFTIQHNSWIALKNHTFRKHHLRTAENRLLESVDRNAKERCLYQWVKRYSQEDYVRRLRQRKLKKKLFGILKNNVAYRELYRQLKVVTFEHNIRRLLSKGLRGFIHNHDYLTSMRNIVSFVQRKRNDCLQNKAFQVLHINSDSNKQQRHESATVEEFRRKQTLSKTFRNLQIGTQKKQRLVNAYTQLQDKTQKSLVLRYFSIMLNKSTRKIHLKDKLTNLLAQKVERGKRRGFYGLLTWYFTVRQHFQIAKKRDVLKRTGLVYGKWFRYARERCEKKRAIKSYLMHKEISLEGKYFSAWHSQVSQERNKLHRKKLAAVFFFRNFLAKCLHGFKLNAYLHRVKRDKIGLIGFMRVKKLFTRMREVLYKNIVMNRYILLKEKLRMQKIMVQWHQGAKRQVEGRERLTGYVQQKEKLIKTAVLRELFENTHLGNSQLIQAYKTLFSRRILISKYQTFTTLKNFTSHRKTTAHLQLKLTQSTQHKSLESTFSSWRHAAYQSEFTRVVLEPYLLQKNQQNLQSLFNAFKSYRQTRKQDRANLLKADEVHNRLVQFNTFECFKQLLQQKRRQQAASTDFLIALKRKVFTSLKNFMEYRQSVDESAYLVREQHVKRVKFACLIKWIDNWNKHQLRTYALSKLRSAYHSHLKHKYMHHLHLFMAQQQRKQFVKATLQTYRAQLTEIMHSQIRQRYFQYWVQQYEVSAERRYLEVCERRVAQMGEISRKMRILAAFKALKRTQVWKEDRENGLKVLEAAIDKVHKRGSLEALKEYLFLDKKAVRYFHNRVQPDTQRRCFATLKTHLMRRQQHNSIIRLSQLSHSKLLKSKALLAFQQKLHLKHQLASHFSTLTTQYKSSLVTKGFIVLQWYRMKQAYFSNLEYKAISHYTERQRLKGFRGLKRMLVVKFKGLHLSRLQEFKALAKFMIGWKQAYNMSIERSQSDEEEAYQPYSASPHEVESYGNEAQEEEEENAQVYLNYHIKGNHLYLQNDELESNSDSIGESQSI